MRRRSSSVSSRYFLARLRPLGRPMVWGPAIALLLLTLFTWDWWTRPEWSAYFSESPNREEPVSREDQAIGADIDSLPVLLNDIGIRSGSNQAKPAEQPALGQPGGTTAPQSLGSNAASLATAFPETTPAQPGIFGALNNGLANQYGQAVSPNSGQSDSAAQPSVAGENLFGLAPLSPTVPTKSPLQEAMTRLDATPASTPSGGNLPTRLADQPPMPVEGTTRLDSPGIDATKPTQPASNSYTTLVEGSQPYAPPANYPATVAPPVASPSIGPNSNLPPLNLADPVGQPVAPTPANPFGTSVYGSPSSTLDAPAQPFSAPRQIPGRTIGGGKINTFSNP
ncbi:hypothetical protein [Myxacorys almedinensis]|uniref:Uncharacterized protein n=1 Tax=Myxacorys almedinensis A TaxID=2690445 RepID=A0A8J7YYD1_9CYAN|nr:hypothetical protein [Myxacorys almedinensis]NDJ16882.1 hypothetical protein [Myxacorys almedinensis A]